jgi:hypothetical protein
MSGLLFSTVLDLFNYTETNVQVLRVYRYTVNPYVLHFQIMHSSEKAAYILKVKINAPLNLQPKSTIFTVKYSVFPIS